MSEPKIVQISACVDNNSRYLYVLLDDGRIFLRSKPSMFSKDFGDAWKWEELDLSGLNKLLIAARASAQPQEKQHAE